MCIRDSDIHSTPFSVLLYCILGINFLQETGCLIDMGKRIVELRREADEAACTVPMIHIEVVDTEEEEEIIRNIDKKVESIDCGDKGMLMRLREILVRNRSLFRERPGRIEGYVHEFQVTDRTPNFQRGWPLPLAYKGKVDDEIRRMLRYGVIERCNSCLLYTSMCIRDRVTCVEDWTREW